MSNAVRITWPSGTIRDIAEAILYTLAYADLFDYPLKTREIHRYLTGYRAPLATVEEQLTRNSQLGQHLASESSFWFLAGRGHLVGLRREREAFSQALWPEARRYSRLIAAVPFVRMVSVTGSLAMNNVNSPEDDIDLLLVTARDRVWLARGLAILVVHLARRFGVEVCPNYVISEQRLKLAELNLFTAHELAQLVPICGLDTYHRLLESNAWFGRYLPNASPRQDGVHEAGLTAHCGHRLLESVLGGRLGYALEQWERERKIPRLVQEAAQLGGTGTIYAPDLCKGHADDHGTEVVQRFAAKLGALGV
jgi:hypothetical protein